MIAYKYNHETKILESIQPCQRDHIASAKAGKEIYLLPANCTYEVPPEPNEGYNIVWNGTMWDYKEIPKEEKPEPEEHIPTVEEKIAQLDVQYNSDKYMLLQYYLEFSVTNNTEGMESIRTELDNLNKQYDSDLKALEGVNNNG